MSATQPSQAPGTATQGPVPLRAAELPFNEFAKLVSALSKTHGAGGKKVRVRSPLAEGNT